MALTKITNSAIADDIGLGGNPTTSTQTAGDSTTRIATTAFVSTAVANLVDSAPDTLNTLAELATSIGNNATLSSTLTTSIATKLPLAGGTLTGNILFNDSVVARWGNGADLKIYHDGSNSYIEDSGTGNLKIRTNALNIMNAANNQNMISAAQGAAVILYYNNSAKLTTTNTGIDVTGTISSGAITATGTTTLSGLTVDGSAAVKHANSTAYSDSPTWTAQSFDTLQVYNDNATSSTSADQFSSIYMRADGSGNAAARIILRNDNSGNGRLYFQMRSGSHTDETKPKMLITDDGYVTISDNATTYNERLFVDGNLRVEGVYKSGTQTIIDANRNLTNIGTISSGAITADGLALGDNDKATFGAGDDLQIYHDGSNSFIDDAGTGNLQIRGTQVKLQKYTGENMFVGISDGAASMYYDNEQKIATTATGIDVTGTATMDGLTVDGGNTIRLNSSSGDDFLTISQGTADANITADSTAGNANLKLFTTASGTTRERLDISFNGDISFYEDTGTTVKLFWDASAESLGIGTVSPDNTLMVQGASTDGTASSGNVALFEGPSGTNGLKIFIDDTENAAGLQTIATDDLLLNPHGGNVGIGTSSPAFPLDISGDRARIAGGTTTTFAGLEVENSNGFGTIFGTGGSERTDLLDNRGFISAQSATGGLALGTEGADPVVFYTGGTTLERMRIDSAGNLLVGDTASVTSDLLQIESPASGGGGGIHIRRNDSNNDQQVGIVRFGNNSNANLASIIAKTDGSVDNGKLIFKTRPSGSGVVERMVIEADGDVLVGTSTNLNVLSGTPKLQIGSGTGHASLQFYSGTTSVNGIYFGDTSSANVDRYDGYIEYQHANRLISFRASGTNPLTIKSTGPLLPAGNFGYHTTQEHYTASTPAASYSTASNITYNNSTQYWPDQGEKLICVINARAYTKYIHVKTNLTANNIMFMFRTKGYFYATGCEEQLIGGYTYNNNSVISKSNETVAGNTHSGDTYRASDGSLVLKMDVNQTGYTEGRMLVFFHSHAPSTTSGLTVTAVTQKDDGTNAF